MTRANEAFHVIYSAKLYLEHCTASSSDQSNVYSSGGYV